MLKFSLLSQPFDLDGNVSRLGDWLVEGLESGHFDKFVVRVAFATRSGTSRVFEALAAFNSGDRSSDIVVGINNGVTTAQAVEQLLLAGCSVRALDSPSPLFHPKVYLLRGVGRASCSIGSSNLTGEGLFRNLETNVLCDFEPVSKSEDKELRQVVDWPSFLQSRGASLDSISVSDLESLIKQGRLVDERVKKAKPAPASAGNAKTSAKMATPPMPPPATITGSILVAKKPAAKKKPKEAAPASLTSPTTQHGTPRYFAMTLSAFDCSHKSGTPGTPEIALPEAAVKFFPPVKLQGRKYPDEYFDVLLNSGQSAELVKYRIWQRPPGSGAGHADWRINIKHATMDLTSTAGGDIILFERDFDDEFVLYKVWIMKPSDSRYASLLANCTEETHAAGAAGVKKYGVFA